MKADSPGRRESQLGPSLGRNWQVRGARRRELMFKGLFHSDDVTADVAKQRAAMIEEQLRGRGIRDDRVLAAFADVPRESFIPQGDVKDAYGDFPVPIGCGQTISQPYIVAAMVEVLEVGSEHRVLEVGTGTGYQAAILAQLAAKVWTIERQPELAERARQILQGLASDNVDVVTGDGSLGLPEHAPYDRILVAAAAPRVPESLVAQLADGGRLVLPVGTRSEQQVLVVRKTATGEIATSTHDLCRFVPLVGEQGWES